MRTLASVNSTQVLTDPTIVTLSVTHAKSAQLNPGRYRLIADVDCWFHQGPTAVAAATTSSNFLPAKTYFSEAMIVSGPADAFVEAIAGGAGKLYIEFVPDMAP